MPAIDVEVLDERARAAGVARTRWGLPLLVPGVLAVLLALDVVLRFLPLEPLCFRAWECVTRFPEPHAIFEARKQFRSERTFGNLANIGNLPAWRVYRPQTFTTDELGFRNPPGRGAEAVAAIVLGDSFLAGDGVSDDETLSAQLTGLTHRRIYNAGGPYAYLATVRALAPRLPLAGRRVVVIHSQDVPAGLLRAAEAERGRTRWSPDLERIRNHVRGLWAVSPLQIAAQKAFRQLSASRFMPNVYAAAVLPGRLVTGDVMLFRAEEVSATYPPAWIDALADHYARLAGELRRDGLALAVTLVPNKYTVYRTALADPRPAAADDRPNAALRAALEARGVPALDVTPVVTATARQRLGEGRYLYWLDDTHWNREGIGVVAAAIRDEWFGAERER